MADLNLRADLPEERPVHAQPIAIVLADGWQTTVATVDSEFIEPEEVERRALLLAAAPDLLAALDAMLTEFGARLSDGKPLGYTVGSMQRSLEMVIAAEAAIAKARGDVQP